MSLPLQRNLSRCSTGSQPVRDPVNHRQPQSGSSGATRGPDPVCRRGVLLINLGTPGGSDPSSVRRYLTEFLSDPAVIRLPRGLGWLNRALGVLIARFRAPVSAEMYKKIWTERGSPLKTITEDQVASLAAVLPPGWRVFYAMRYGEPGIVETLRQIEASGIDDLVVIPMYPQYSEPTTGTALKQVYEYLKTKNHPMNVTTRTTWYDDQGYINAQTKLLERYAAAHGLRPDNTFLLFSTHGLPASYVRRGDPYPQHVARTIALVAHRLGWPVDRMSLAYQSRFGPIEWLKPYTDEVLSELVRAGESRVLVCPVSFTVDCLETLEEIDIRYREAFEKLGAELYLAPALNNFRPFISALKHLVLRGPRPVREAVPVVRPFASKPRSEDPAADDLATFVMIGVSSRGRLGGGRGPSLDYTAPEDLRRVKVSQCDVPALLERIREKTSVREAWLWNTCHRFEFYGWIDPSLSRRLPQCGFATPARTTAERLSVAPQEPDEVDDIRRLLFGETLPPGVHVNVLHDAEARHHLMRTGAGLNSGLPGERDVLEQLKAAHRLASCAGSAGPLTERLMADVIDAQTSLRDSTGWGRYATDYTFAAISQIAKTTDLNLAASRIVVIGGSTTSAGALRTLAEHFDVPSRQLTLIYRGHKRGGQVKLLRKAIGNGRRIRVQSYAERRVADAVADADVVVFGVDREEPVFTRERLGPLRDWSARPLTIFDFNVFGSTEGVEDLPGIRLYPAGLLETQAAVLATRRCETEAFRRALEEAEAWILQHGIASPTGVKAGAVGDDPGARIVAQAERPLADGLRACLPCAPSGDAAPVNAPIPAGVKDGLS